MKSCLLVSPSLSRGSLGASAEGEAGAGGVFREGAQRVAGPAGVRTRHLRREPENAARVGQGPSQSRTSVGGWRASHPAPGTGQVSWLRIIRLLLIYGGCSSVHLNSLFVCLFACRSRSWLLTTGLPWRTWRPCITSPWQHYKRSMPGLWEVRVQLKWSLGWGVEHNLHHTRFYFIFYRFKKSPRAAESQSRRRFWETAPLPSGDLGFCLSIIVEQQNVPTLPKHITRCFLRIHVALFITVLALFRTRWTLWRSRTEPWRTKPSVSKRPWGRAPMNRLWYVSLENTHHTWTHKETLKYIYMFTVCPGSISAYWGRPEEPEGGFGDEEPANSWPGEEDLSAGESGKLNNVLYSCCTVSLQSHLFSIIVYKYLRVCVNTFLCCCVSCQSVATLFMIFTLNQFPFWNLSASVVILFMICFYFKTPFVAFSF